MTTLPAEDAPPGVEAPPPAEAAPVEEALADTPKPLSTVPVPIPDNIDAFIADKDAAIVLGKAWFWDMQVGSDGKTACASCHFHAGVDNRTTNTVNPGVSGDAFRGANKSVKASDFPFHRLKNPFKKRSSDNPVIFDTSEVVGSQGVVRKDFLEIILRSAIDRGKTVPDPIFTFLSKNTRQVTGRNTPTMINAVFNDRNFWDGRANHFFNGVNPFGDADPDARVWVYRGGELGKVRILLNNASLASQAVGPPLSDAEMSWKGRTFPELGRKMLSLRPLFKQRVRTDDSVLGPLAVTFGRGLKVTYPALIKKAFHPKWWSSPSPTPDGYTQMEANFSLFWGLAFLMYERTLVSDQTPFDKFAAGDSSALSDKAKKGLEIFLNEGKCISCHSGPEFTGVAISQIRRSHDSDEEEDEEEGLIEFMKMERGPEAFYDGAFYNIGVRPTEEDLGVGARHPVFGPLSLTRRVQEGQRIDLNGQHVKIGPNDRVAVDGAFKTPGLRNIELTGPYMHNGGMKSLREVVLFYVRRADFFKENIDNLDPDVDGIDELQDDEEKVEALVEFLKSLTDERVRLQKAPFDHPELWIPHGHMPIRSQSFLPDRLVHIRGVGKNGGPPLISFEDRLTPKRKPKPSLRFPRPPTSGNPKPVPRFRR